MTGEAAWEGSAWVCIGNEHVLAKGDNSRTVFVTSRVKYIVFPEKKIACNEIYLCVKQERV